MQSENPSDNKKLENLKKDSELPGDFSEQPEAPYSSESKELEERLRSESDSGIPSDEEFPPESKPKTLIAHAKRALKSLRDWLNDKRAKLYDWLNSKFGKLTFSQWCYFVAFIVLVNMATDDQTEDTKYITVGIIAGLGLMRELWHVFSRMWEHTLGKGVLLVLYAATANFALAISALKINSISGIEPSIFVFTMGFTTLLMLPFWILTASIMFLGTAIIIGNLWLLLGLTLRIVGVRLKLHWEDQSFAVITMIFRFVLIPFLIYVLLQIMNPYLKQLDMFESPLDLSMFSDVDTAIINPAKFSDFSEEELTTITNQIRNPNDTEVPAELQAKIDSIDLTEIEKGIIREMSARDLQQLIKRLQQVPGNITVTGANEILTSSEVNIETTELASEEGVNIEVQASKEAEAEIKVLDNLIARFIYRFETYPYSSCAKEEHQRVLMFDEDSMLVAERDDSQELGIKFYVAPCEPAYYQPRLRPKAGQADKNEADESQ